MEKKSIKELVLNVLLSQSRQGLNSLGIAQSDINRYLGIIESRVSNGQTGSVWQKKYVEKNNASMKELIKSYRKNRLTGKPVHSWSV